MLKKTATVVKINDQDIWVRTTRQTACGHCAANQGCGVSLLGDYFNNNVGQVSVRSEGMRAGDFQVGDFQVGDNVIVGVQERALIKGSLLVYLLPLVFMIGFSLFGQFLSTIIGPIDSAVNSTLNSILFNAEGLTVIFAFVGLALGFYFVKYVSKKINNDFDFRAMILEQ